MFEFDGEFAADLPEGNFGICPKKSRKVSCNPSIKIFNLANCLQSFVQDCSLLKNMVY